MRATKLLCSLTILVSLLSAQRDISRDDSVTALPAHDKRWALLIGVDEYDDRNITRLQGAANDARAMKATLVRHGGFREDQTVVLASGEPDERRPTRTNILAYLSNLAAAVPRDGLLLIAFSGHGLERNGRAFLLPADARLSNDAEFLEDVSVSVNRMRQRINQAGVQQVVVLLDACRNDPGGRADAPNPLTEAFARGFRFDVRNREVTAFATLYATKVGDRAWEYSEKKRGYFSWALEEALSGKAANTRGEVTLGSVIRYVQERVPKQVAIDMGSERRQLPFAELGGYRADDLVLAVAASAAPVVARLPEFDAVAESYNAVKDSRDPALLEEFAKRFSGHPLAAAAEFRAKALRGPAVVDRPNPVVSSPRAAEERTNPRDGLTYVWIPPGRFTMGCSPGDKECEDDESPAHLVTISKGFWMGKSEVTQAAYEKVTGANPSPSKGVSRPVVVVSWNEADSYCRKIGGRLPTEAEWEYATRAGSTGARYGNLDQIAWHGGNSGQPNGMTTRDVMTKAKNDFGLHDMLGNVWEWVAVWYGPYGAPATEDPTGPDTGKYKSVRGGSSFYDPQYLRASYRYRGVVTRRQIDLGFRCASEVP